MEDWGEGDFPGPSRVSGTLFFNKLAKSAAIREKSHIEKHG
jgi:hypothetical protein